MMKIDTFHFSSTLICLAFFCFTCTVVHPQMFERVENRARLSVLRENNGVAVADYDGDLDLDIFIVAKANSNINNAKTLSRLFRNDSNGVFTDVTQVSGLLNALEATVNEQTSGVDGIKSGASWGDFNNDGFPDLFLTSYTQVQFFKNNGDGTFTDITAQASIDTVNGCANMGATWFDVNNDGFLDLYIADWGECSKNTLYLNNGDETFSNVSEVFFDDVPTKSSYQSIPFDFNQDGWMDLYVSEDFTEPNSLFINQNGTGFIDEAASYGLDSKKDDMGIAIGDYNNDGFFDLYIATINLNPLFKNRGDNTFEDVADSFGMVETGWAWGPIFADFDLDGDEDLFVTNGFKSNIPVQEENYYFKNLFAEGQNTFDSVSDDLQLNGLATSVTPVAFDYDNDGDLDLFVSNSDKASHFYENKTIDNSENLNWFQAKLEGKTSNRDAIGAIVKITTSNGNQIRHNSFITHLSQSLKPMHFGLGDQNQIQNIEISWPSGLIENYIDFESNTSFLFIEGEGFQEYAIPEVIKKRGCTDPNSCTYDPDAVIDDGSCTYLPASNIITGNTTPLVLGTESYEYMDTTGTGTFEWRVTGGEITSGFGTNRIIVKWGVHQNAALSAKKIDLDCQSQTTVLPITLSASSLPENSSVARLWNEALLEAIRGDFARPTVHARNLFHTSIALYDAWAILDENARPYLIGNEVQGFTSTFEGFTSEKPTKEAREEAISYAVYRLLSHRFKNAPSAEDLQQLFNFLMSELGHDTALISTDYKDGDAAALGNFIAQTIIEYGNTDGARESSDYGNEFYEPVNQSLFPSNAGNPFITNPNRWQPLSLNQFIDQSGNLIETSRPDFLSPEWGSVNPFSLGEEMKNIFERDGNDYTVFHDPGMPPLLNLNGDDASSNAYKWGFSLVSIWSSHLDPNDNVLWDISPNSIGNIESANFPERFTDYPSFYKTRDGGDIGGGHTTNPITGNPYEEQWVPRGDYARVLAEFWADGPDSETPPGHWFTILNYVNDNELLEKRLQGEGDILDTLEWDVKAYFLLGGAMHDAAISAWSVKGWYDYIRPISAIRYMADLGQSSNMAQENYHIAGIPLEEGLIEVVEADDPLVGRDNQNLGKIKLYTWRGPDFINDAATDFAGVGWILAENWWPYQRPSFVTPPFAGYVSGHSTYSRAAAEVLTLLTGSKYFPGGMGEFIARKDEFLVFEEGPSVDIKLQWATYRDASDQCSLSRIWGGIHPPADDIPGRLIGEIVGVNAFDFGIQYFEGKLSDPKDEIIPETKSYIIYPNPTEATSVTIANTLETDEFSLFDMIGRKMSISEKRFDTLNGTTTIEFKSMTSGLYILKINDTAKLVIKR